MGRDKLALFLPNREAVKAFEHLVEDVAITLPDATEAVGQQVDSVRLGVFGPRQSPDIDVRAGDGIALERDAAGYIISADLLELLLASSAFLARSPVLSVRAGSRATVTQDAAGYIVSGPAFEDASNIIANKAFGARN